MDGVYYDSKGNLLGIEVEKPVRLIDANHLIKRATHGDDRWSCTFESEEAFVDYINAEPTIDTFGTWIPVSEKLPDEAFGCLVTVEDMRFNGMVWFDCISLLPYFVGWDGEQWNDDNGEKCPFEVIAWMPLPQEYRGESE